MYQGLCMMLHLSMLDQMIVQSATYWLGDGGLLLVLICSDDWIVDLWIEVCGRR